jgi:mycothiol synthase
MLEVRPCRDDAEREISLEIYNCVWPEDAISMVEVRAWQEHMLAWTDVLAFVDGEPAGSVAAALMPQKPGIGLMLLTVLPEHIGRSAGSGLYAHASRWLATHDVAETEALVREDDDRSMQWALRRGFSEVQRNGRMVLDLGDVDPPPVDPPPGVEIVTWAQRPDTARGMYEVALEAVPDIPGDEDYEVEPFDDWLRHQMGGPGDRPEATFVALAADEVVGYAKFSLTAARPETASHDITGVKRAWRGKGVAGALKRAQIAWAKEQGFERLTTANEARNDAIRRLNDRLGYRPAPGRVIVRGPLAEP